MTIIDANGEGGGEQDHAFMMLARDRAKQHGAMIVEWFVCDLCRRENVVLHSWSEVLPCCYEDCNHRNASKVPRLPQPGEVTTEVLSVAMQIVRDSYPEVADENVKKWVREKCTDQMQIIAAAVAGYEVRRALDKVREHARTIVGTHQKMKAPT